MMKKISVFLLSALLCACDPAAKQSTAKSEPDSAKTDTLVTADSTAAEAQSRKVLLDDDSVSLTGISKTDAQNMFKDFEANSFGIVKPKKQVSVFFNASAIKGMYDVLTKDRSLVADGKIGQTDGFRVYFVNKSANKDEFSVVLVATKYAGKKGNVDLHRDYYHDKKGNSTLDSVNFGDRRTGDCDGGAQIYNPCTTCPDVNCQIDPEHRLARKFAQEMTTSNFGNTPINTRAVWFKYSLLKNLITSTILKNMSGIRIYYGNYGQMDALGNRRAPTDERKGRYTFIFMPTVAAKNTAGKDIDLDKLSDCKPIPLLKQQNQKLTQEQLQNKSAQRALELKKIEKILQDGGYNNGELCPDHCNEHE